MRLKLEPGALRWLPAAGKTVVAAAVTLALLAGCGSPPNLSKELAGARVSSGRGAAAASDHRVAIDITRFESSFAQGATLEAAWTVSGKAGAPKPGRTLARVPAASADYAGVAGAHSRALEQLAREIAAAITSR